MLEFGSQHHQLDWTPIKHPSAAEENFPAPQGRGADTREQRHPDRRDSRNSEVWWSLMSCWFRQIPHDPTWSHMIPHDPTWSHMIPYDPTWSHMIPYDPTWSHMIPHDPTWSHMIPYDPTWSHMIPYDPTWSHMIPYDPTWSHGPSAGMSVFDVFPFSVVSSCAEVTKFWAPDGTKPAS